MASFANAAVLSRNLSAPIGNPAPSGQVASARLARVRKAAIVGGKRRTEDFMTLIDCVAHAVSTQITLTLLPDLRA